MQPEDLIQVLKSDLDKPQQDRETGASDVSLKSVISLLQEGGGPANNDHAAQALDAYNSAAHLISDSWSYSSVLGAEVLAFVMAARRSLTS